MNSIQIIDKTKIRFRKSWAEKDIELIKCLGMTLRSDSKGNIIDVVADIRVTSKEALLGFMKSCFPIVMLDPNRAGYRKRLFSDIKKMYDDSYSRFLSVYKPNEMYSGAEKSLRAHQNEALWVMCGKRYNLCAMEQGTGKTITGASLSKMLNIKKTIIICPSLVKWNWFHELSDEWGYNPLYISVLDRNPAKSIRAYITERFMVINYEMVNKHFEYLTRDHVGHIIIDECHYCKNHKTLRYKGVQRLIKAFPDVRVTLLTGTPITNRVIDLFAYLKLSKHELGRNYMKFRKNYTRGAQKIVGAKNVSDLRLKISNFMFRKKSEECLDLPPLNIKKYYFQMDEFQEDYDSAMEEMYLKNKRYEEIVEEIQRIKQGVYSASEQELKDLKKEQRELKMATKANINTLNRLVAISKIPNIIKLIDSLNDLGRKVIVFSSYKDPMNLLKKHYEDKCVLIDGSVPAYDRQKEIEKFKKDPKTTVFVGQVIAAGIGINLVNACDVIFCNFPFTPDLLEQPYKRAHRGGQTKPVNVYYTICKETIDEKIYKLIAHKIGDINEVLDEGKKGVINYGGMEDQLFSELITQYKKDHNIAINSNQFQKV